MRSGHLCSFANHSAVEVEMEITKAAALGTGGVPILHASR
jgi:hypothetical protein